MTRATEHAEGEICGNRLNVWSYFDQRRRARANDGGDVLESVESEADMFAAVGIAAE